MATPFPFTTGQLLTAAQMNSIGEAGTSFTPTWSGYTRGNGTTIAKYVRVNKLVYVYVEETLGSTSSVTGELILTLPLTAADAVSANGQILFRKPGTVANPGGYLPLTTTTISLRIFSVSGLTVALGTTSSTAPFTWATGDKIICTVTFEAA